MKLLLSQRAKLRKQLETFGDVKTWLDNKPTITSSEFKVLCMIRQEQTAPKRTLIPVGKPKVRSHSGQKVLKASGRVLSFCFLALDVTR